MKLDDVARLYSIHDVLGVPVGKHSIVCPLPMHAHQHNSPSFSIFVQKTDGKDYFKCHGNCGAYGDVIDLVGFLKIPYYDPHSSKDRRAAADFLEGSNLDFRDPTPPKPAPRLEPWAWKQYLPPREEVIDYAARRGLSPETLRRFAIGQKGMGMSIPVFHFGKLMGIKIRSLNGGHRYWSLPGSIAGLFNYDGVYGTNEPVFIVKGEIAAMFLEERGFKACAPTGGEGAHVQNYLIALAFSKNIVVGDNDPDPVVRAKMTEFARNRAVLFNAELKFPPSEYKDIDEWLLKKPGDLSVIANWSECD